MERCYLASSILRGQFVNTFKLLVASSLLYAVAANAAPVPAAKTAYIGTWQGKDMKLTIAADGKVAYKRVYSTKKYVDLTMDLGGLSGDDFYAGVGILNSTFVVSKPPSKVGDRMTMVVDGVELTRLE